MINDLNILASFTGSSKCNTHSPTLNTTEPFDPFKCMDISYRSVWTLD